MKLEVVTPEDYFGDVLGDINSRRGQVQGMDQRGNTRVITAMVPLAETFGYATDLRSKTQGRATYSMEFDHYAAGAAERSGRDQWARPSARRRLGTTEETTMAKGKFERNKPHANVGTIGHVDHGKTSADGGDHEGAGAEGRGGVPGVRLDRQRAGGARARDHDRHRARGVRDGRAALRARRLPGARGLHQEHDHRRGADGRGDPGGGRPGRADAADARAPAAGAAGGGALDRRLPEQGGHDGGRGAARAGGAGAARAADGERLPRRRHADHPRLGAEGAGVHLDGPGGAGVRAHLGADGRGGHVHPAAGAAEWTSRS